jgi:5-methyltetrahydrofolate--homocysteine methyltransferase
MEEHANYGVDFITATKTIKETCPFVKISGGISNLSFGFRGVNKVSAARKERGGSGEEVR